MNKSRALQSLIDTTWERASEFTRTIIGKPTSAGESIKFINEMKEGILATIARDGRPHVSWTAFAYADGKLYAYADPHPRCHRNLRSDGRAAAAFTIPKKAVFIEGNSREVGRVNQLLHSLVATIEFQVGEWPPHQGANYSSLSECDASVFEVEIEKIFAYKPAK